MLMEFFHRIKKRLDPELLKGSATSLLVRVFGNGITYVFTLLVTQLYGAKIWGAFSIFLTVLTLTSIISRFGLDSSIVKLIAAERIKKKGAAEFQIYKKAWTIFLPITIVLSIALYLLAEQLADTVFHKPHLTETMRYASFSLLPMVVIFINASVYRSLKRILEFSILDTVIKMLLASLFLVAMYFQWPEWQQAPVRAFMCGLWLAAGFSSLFLLKIFKQERLDVELPTTPLVSYTDILGHSLPMLLTASTVFLMGWTSTLFMGIYWTEEDVGIFNVAFKLATVNSIVLTAINSISAPKFAELYSSGQLEKLRIIVKQSTKMIFWASFPMLLLFLFLPETMLSIFGEEFKVGKWALIYLSIGQFVNAASGSVGNLLQMTGHHRIRRNIMIGITILNVGVNFLLIPVYGIIGAAIATMICGSLANIITAVYVKKKLNFYTFYIPYLMPAK